MATQRVPSDSAVRDSLANLKTYTSYKSNQLQTQGEGGGGFEQAFLTVETWGRDMADDGKDWGKQKDAESNQKIERSQKANRQVETDQQQADQEAQARSQMDMDQFKTETKKKIDDHREAMKQLSDAEKPGFKEKLAESNVESAEAKAFLDDGLEESMDLTAKKNAENRTRRKAFAKRAQEDSEEAQAWKGEYAEQPEKFPQGQRDDVKKALDTIGQGCEAKANELQPLGDQARPHMQKIQTVCEWSEELEPRVDSQGDPLLVAKKDGREGVANARKILLEIEKFQASVESEGNADVETFRQWTDHNNELAAQWKDSDSPKHKQWAEEWMKTQEEAS